MNKKTNSTKDRRDLYVDEVRKHILGPGFAEDVYVYSDLEHEIIDKQPHLIYYTGILYPDQSNITDKDNAPIVLKSKQEPTVDISDEDDNTDFSSVIEDDDQLETIGGDDDEYGLRSSKADEDDREESSEGDDWRATLNPSHIGLIVCLKPDAKVKASIEYARYTRIDTIGVKVKLGGCNIDAIKESFEAYDKEESIKQILSNNELGSVFDIFNIDENDRTISLKHHLTVMKNGVRRPLQTSDFPKIETLPYNERLINVLGKLLIPMYQRDPVYIQPFELDTSKGSKDSIPVPGCSDLVYMTKVFAEGDKSYLKFILRNNTSNQKFYQSKVTLHSDAFSSYHDFVPGSFDQENEETEYIYRDELDYGKGVGCAIEWDEENSVPHWIATTYIPMVAVKKYSNEANTKYDPNIESYCRLHDMSIWGDESKIVPNLEKFAAAYLAWHNEQVKNAEKEPKYTEISKKILGKQQALYGRLKDNIDYLASNQEAMECFKIANTAMYIQMVVARDPKLKKNRDYEKGPKDAWLDNLDFFKNQMSSLNPVPTYRPFQLAFLILNIKPTMDPQDPYRDIVDLIWFPTGGGKTEAYLALTAFTIAYRRRYGVSTKTDVSGVSVIMRYTLRLLTSQQFERASFLICALEFLRDKCPELELGDDNNRISIGMWIGGSSTPNHSEDLEEKGSKYDKFFNSIYGPEPKLPKGNPFPLASCPWCRTKLVTTDNGEIQNGFGVDGTIHCPHYDCHFNSRLPIDYIDEKIYDNPPTLLFATVDKFANLYLNEAGELFGIGTKNRTRKRRCPDLIIQDELHLVSGPLGSMVGLFETIVEELCTNNGIKPRIIASTATTRNTDFLVKQLYRREVSVFPASGLKYDDNYFSHVEVGNKKRLHMGIIPTGQSSVMTEIDLVAILIVARFKLIIETLKNRGVDLFNHDAVLNALTEKHVSDNQDTLDKEIDEYWSLVLYYNSLKDLGRSKSRIPQEIMERIRVLYSYTENYEALDFILKGLDQRNEEFTSRQDSSRIKELLTEAESRTKLVKTDHGNWRIASKMDIVQASNMISVGIDIARWNLMIMVGQPRSTAEYIQSSSRVARADEGLVVNLLNPNRNREHSLFENYTSFHNMYYKFVEPLSATPFTEMTLDRMLANMFITYMKHIKGVKARDVDSKKIDDFKTFILSKTDPSDVQLRDYINSALDVIAQKWLQKIKGQSRVDYNAIHKLYNLSKSMRSVDAYSALMIKDIDYYNNN